MRMMMKVSIPTEAGNKAVADNILPKVIGEFVEAHRPEGSYFTTHHGERCAYFFFDLKDNASIPSIAEPFFMKLNAHVDIQPAMNLEDMKTGVERAMKKR